MVEVENTYQGYDRNWNWRTFANTHKFSNRCHARLLREARAHFEAFGIDFSQFDNGVVIMHENIVAQVQWTHQQSQRQIKLLRVYFNEKTGAILQCGENFGDIVS